jgi:signal peptidase I
MKREGSRSAKSRKAGRRSSPDAAAARDGRGASPKKSALREWIEVVVVGLLVVSLFRGVVAQAYQIPSGSMEDTLLVGDFLIVNKFIYGLKVPFTDTRLPGIRDPQ